MKRVLDVSVVSSWDGNTLESWLSHHCAHFPEAALDHDGGEVIVRHLVERVAEKLLEVLLKDCRKTTGGGAEAAPPVALRNTEDTASADQRYTIEDDDGKHERNG